MKNAFKNMFAVGIALLSLVSLLCGCGTKTLTCDRCGKEYKVPDSSNIEQDWINYCPDCAEEMGLNDMDFGG